MTKEEIKQSNSMAEVVGRYGLKPNRAGFIPCQFHKEKTASMKIYESTYHCFGCGANGDIFSFVEQMETVSFKEAFQILGGTYEKPTFSSQIAVYKSQKRAETIRKQHEKERKERLLNNLLITVYRRYIGKLEPLTDAWCDCQNRLSYQMYLHEESERRW